MTPLPYQDPMEFGRPAQIIDDLRECNAVLFKRLADRENIRKG
jgi:hypothetical protein